MYWSATHGYINMDNLTLSYVSKVRSQELMVALQSKTYLNATHLIWHVSLCLTKNYVNLLSSDYSTGAKLRECSAARGGEGSE